MRLICSLFVIHDLLVGISRIIDLLLLRLFFLSVSLVKLFTFTLEFHLLFRLFIFKPFSCLVFFGFNLFHLTLEIHLQLSFFIFYLILTGVCLLSNLELVLIEDDLRLWLLDM